MLASDYRLKKPRDIARVFKRGRFANAGALSIKYDRNGLDVSRLVIVVSKKVSKKATVRNRIRRRVSGILEERWQTVQTGYDIVITVREDVSDLAAPALNKLADTLLERAGLRSEGKPKPTAPRKS